MTFSIAFMTASDPWFDDPWFNTFSSPKLRLRLNARIVFYKLYQSHKAWRNRFLMVHRNTQYALGCMFSRTQKDHEYGPSMVRG